MKIKYSVRTVFLLSLLTFGYVVGAGSGIAADDRDYSSGKTVLGIPVFSSRSEQRADEIAEARHQEELARIRAATAGHVASPVRDAERHAEEVRQLREAAMVRRVDAKTRIRSSTAAQVSECLARLTPELATQSRILAEVLEKSIGSVMAEDLVRQQVTEGNRGAIKTMLCSIFWGGPKTGLSVDEAKAGCAIAKDRDARRAAQQDRIVDQIADILVKANQDLDALDAQDGE